MDQIKIGKFIAELRKEKKLTQEELAVLLGVSNNRCPAGKMGKTCRMLHCISRCAMHWASA